MTSTTKQFFHRGESWVWVSSAALAFILIILAVLIGILAFNGLGVFWPKRVAELTLKDGQKLMGEIVREESAPGQTGMRLQIKTGNRDLNGLDFQWVDRSRIAALRYPAQAIVLERQAYGNFYGYSKDSNPQANSITVIAATGLEKNIPLSDIVRSYRPNRMTFFAKSRFYLAKLRELLFSEPRESNTEGGVFPAIVGTVTMVFLMSILSFPLGVMGGVYLREYAREGLFVRCVRIAVNNLAGIPSIVFGVFGLGFFIYGAGGAIDGLFFPDRLPAPTFGTGGILWASLTLGLLTVPVVIIATEEALSAIPGGIKEASLSLGATQFQTLCRLLLPMASPGILTGFILAMARAAGEVAPLMITGAVKLAPALPIDGAFPFMHLERKFMHLGFHIYDLAFQSPNVEATRPMVFVTSLLLILIVLGLCSAAIHLRNTMKKRYSLKTI